MSGRVRFLGLLLASLATSPLLAGPLPAVASRSPAERRAAFVATLPLAVEWPTHRAGPRPIRVCAMGTNGFSPAFARELMGDAASRMVFEPQVGRFEFTACDMLYVAPSGLAEYEATKFQIGALPIVTIGEGESFLDHGGMIAFTQPAMNAAADHPLRFRICPTHAEKSGLRFDPMLIELAETVRTLP